MHHGISTCITIAQGAKDSMKMIVCMFILLPLIFQNAILFVQGDTKLCTVWIAAEDVRLPLANSRRNFPSIAEESEEDIDDDEDSKNTNCTGDNQMIRRVRVFQKKNKNSNNGGKAKEVLVRNGKCFNKSSFIDVKFGKEVLYSVCHDENIDHTYYVKSYIDGAQLANGAETGARPTFQEDQFFPTIHADKSYSKAGQLKTMEYLLGSNKLATKYIKSKGNNYFARGHLFPNADPAAKVERDATFYYVNTFPQWQPMNMGNWNQLEGFARKLAKAVKGKLNIWTGTFGIMELPNEKDKKVELWFGRDDKDEVVAPKRLPVPYLAWKVIHYEQCNQAVVIVQLNNPWDDSEKPFCASVCEQISWIKWDMKNRNKGYTYCCDAVKFPDLVSFAPKLDKNVKLLKDIPKGKQC